MRRIIFVVIRAIIILFILNIFTNDYFGYTLINILVLSLFSLPGIIIIYFITLL